MQVAIGSLDCPERVEPQDRVWTRGRISWFQVAGELPKFERSSIAVPGKAEDE